MRRSWTNPGGYADPAGFRAALDGVDTLYLVSAAEAEDRLQQHLDAVDAAVAAGVQRIVYTSFVGAKRRRRLHPGAAARGDRGARSGRPASGATFLRHSMYADFVPFFATLEDGRAVIAAPAGEGRTSFVSRDDLADVGGRRAARRLRPVDGQALEVTGPEALSMAEAAGRADRGHRPPGRVPRRRRSRRRGRPAVPPGTRTGRSRAG